MAQPKLPENFDINDPDVYQDHLPREEWAELRRTAPIWWQAQPRGRDGFDDDASARWYRAAALVDDATRSVLLRVASLAELRQGFADR